MGVQFNAEETYRIGIEIEKNGRTFYETAAKRTADPAVAKLFADLARWEDGHVETFSELLAAFDKPGAAETMEDVNDEVLGYLHAAADSHVFGPHSDPAALAAACKTPREALEKALGFEKDSVVVYTTMRMLVPAHLGRDKVDILVDEELKHITILREQIDRLADR
jgi:rubrerythrin